MAHESVIIEFQQVGGAVKVTAFDPVSLVDVSIMGSSAATREQLSEVVLRKLHYVIDKKRREHDT